MTSRPLEVVEQRDLPVGGFALDHDDPAPDRLDQRRVVGRLAARSVSAAERLESEGLRSLHRDQCGPVGGVDDATVGVDHLDRVGHRDSRDRSVGTVAYRCDHPLVQLGAGQRAGRIVHTHHVDAPVVGHLCQPRTHRLAPGRSAGHTAFAFGIGLGHHDDDGVAGVARHPARPVDDPLTRRERLVLLGPSETLTAPTADHDRPHCARCALGSVMPHGRAGYTVTDVMALEEILARTDFFADADPDALSVVAGAGHERHLIRGDVLFNEGDPPEALYLVLRGRLAIAIANPIDRRESVVALMEPDDLFGEMGMLDDGPRSAMARALEPTTVFEIPFGPVLQMFEEHPKLLWNVTRLLAQRIRVTDEALADSVFLDVTGRTAKRLLELADGADEFTLPVTQEELAGMVGASRERVNKAIASFIRLGWLAQHDRTYKIVQRDRLELRAR